MLFRSKKSIETPKKSKSNISPSEDGNDRSESENPYQKQQVARWEKQWVAIPNVIEFSPEIWLKKWVLVHDSFDNRKRSDSHSQYSEFSGHESLEEKIPKKLRKDQNKRYVCQFPNCGKSFADSSALRKHMATHGEKMVFDDFLVVCMSTLRKEVFRQLEIKATSIGSYSTFYINLRESALSNVKYAGRGFRWISILEHTLELILERNLTSVPIQVHLSEYN